MAWNPVNDIKKWFNKVKEEAQKGINSIKSAANSAKRQVEDTAHKVEDGVKKVGREAESGVRKVAKETEDAFAKKLPQLVEQEIGKKLPHALEDVFAKKLPKIMEETFAEKLPDLVTKQAPRLAVKIVKEGTSEALKFASELQSALSGPGLRAIRSLVRTTHNKLTELTEKEPELVEDLNAIGGGIRVGLIKAEFSGYFTRMGIIVGVLDRYIANPPTFRRREVREFMTALGPTSIQFTGSVKANIICVGSSVMEIEADINGIPFRLGIRAVDEILKAAGVPE